jgi:hypothetical protein
MNERLVGTRLLLERAKALLASRSDVVARELLHDVNNVIVGLVLLEALEEKNHDLSFLYEDDCVVAGRITLDRVRVYADARKLRFLMIDSPTPTRLDTEEMGVDAAREALARMHEGDTHPPSELAALLGEAQSASFDDDDDDRRSTTPDEITPRPAKKP